MSQQPEHDIVFIRGIEFDRIDFKARTKAIEEAFLSIMREMHKMQLSIVQHTVVAMTDCYGVVLIIHGRKIDTFDDEPQCHIVKRTSPVGGPFEGECTRCGKKGLSMPDANERCFG